MIKVQDLDEAQCLKGLRYNVNVGKGATAVSTVLVCNAVCTVAQCLKRLKYNVNVGKGATAQYWSVTLSVLVGSAPFRHSDIGS